MNRLVIPPIERVAAPNAGGFSRTKTMIHLTGLTPSIKRYSFDEMV